MNDSQPLLVVVVHKAQHRDSSRSLYLRTIIQHAKAEMSNPIFLPATESMQNLCQQQRDKEVQSERGPLREYKATITDTKILCKFENEHAHNIRRQALHKGKIVSKARNYGPRELDKGTIASPERTITVFIPLATQTADTQRVPKVLYQPDKDKAEFRQPLPWDIGNHIQIPGNSRIVVEEGPVGFDMVQYDWEPAEGQESKDE
ncbi:hypothetical protein FOCG_18567 [Fusarium oxysporum f. sp. radicis-lycopersici 26381]|nr:hypothetical protein FOCG_18567 [Fusarium oxysporum f. sp. radicis-lycopersici 26381]